VEREKGGGTRDRFSRGDMDDMETPQHGNGSKIIFEEFPFFLNSRKSLKSSELLSDFQIFCIRFPIFRVK